MKKEPLFKKKVKSPEGEVTEAAIPEAQQAPTKIEEGEAPKKDAADSDNDDGGTVRLSCDLPRKHHRALRIAAAHCERSITEMLETLLECHLLHTEIGSIVNDYHKNSVKWFKIR